MATELRLPELGENIDSGNVVKVLVSVGDTIEENQPVVELETDKATIEVPSSVSGKVQEIRIKEGEKARVGEVILTVESAAKGEEKKAVPKEKAKPPVVEQVEPVKEPQEEAGEKKSDEQLTQVAAESSRSGKAEIQELQVQSPEKTERPRNVVPFKPEEEAAPSVLAPAAPSVRRLAREIGVDISQVKGTGPRGRISSDDVKRYARMLNTASPAVSSISRSSTAALPNFEKWGAVDRQPMTNIRQKTAEHMAVAWTSIPHVTQFDKADITELEDNRKKYGARAEAAGGKLTVTAILLKVVASALRVFPQFNASIDVANNQIIYKQYYHVGVAVDTDRGLLVPVVRDVDSKNILQLAKELTELAEKARNKKLTLEEMQGGSFTITNLGGIGGTYFTPIVNHPEVAILGISRGNLEPVFSNGNFEPRMMLPLSLSYDHRIIDGADAARFLRWVAEALRDPFLLALEG